MIRNVVTPDQAIDYLNDLVALDAKAMERLVECRIPCNEQFAEHPTVQVVPDDAAPPDTVSHSVGLLGILNGLFGVDDDSWGTLSAVFEDDGTLVKFQRTKRAKASPRTRVFCIRVGGPVVLDEPLTACSECGHVGHMPIPEGLCGETAQVLIATCR